MKTKYIISTIALTGVLALTGCEDFLEQKNTHDLNQQTFFDSEAALRAATAPLYNYVWAGFNDKFYYGMGDGRANNITAQYSDYIYPYTNLSETSLSQGLTDAWNSFYSVVAQANNTINNITDYSAPTLSEDSKRVSIAEARFMRGTAYWYIASLWGVGIIYTNTSSMVNNYVVPANPGVDVIEFAIRDLEYAAKYLPKTPADAGRVTCYSAYGMLSRVYLSMAGLTTDGLYNGSNVATDFNRGTRNQTYLDLAKRAALKVIAESGAGLIDNYGDLFAAKSFNNNSESLFQLQWLPATQANSSACGNTMVRFLAWSTMVADKDAWGGATYCSWNLWEEFKTYKDETLGKTVDDAVRRHYSVASYGEFYPDMNMKNGGYTYGQHQEIRHWHNGRQRRHQRTRQLGYQYLHDASGRSLSELYGSRFGKQCKYHRYGIFQPSAHPCKNGKQKKHYLRRPTPRTPYGICFRRTVLVRSRTPFLLPPAGGYQLHEPPAA
mgnify:CR=1 FL=1